MPACRLGRWRSARTAMCRTRGRQRARCARTAMRDWRIRPRAPSRSRGRTPCRRCPVAVQRRSRRPEVPRRRAPGDAARRATGGRHSGKPVMRIFGKDLVLLHPPSVYDFRKTNALYGPISDVVPSSPVFEMYPMGLTSIANHLENHGFNVLIVNIAYRMLQDPAFDAEAEIARLNPAVFGIDLHWLPHAHGAIELARI